MSVNDIIRAWKDEDYLEGLGDAQLALLPENPAGAAEVPHVSDEDMEITATCTKIECSNAITCQHGCYA